MPEFSQNRSEIVVSFPRATGKEKVHIMRQRELLYDNITQRKYSLCEDGITGKHHFTLILVMLDNTKDQIVLT